MTNYQQTLEQMELAEIKDSELSSGWVVSRVFSEWCVGWRHRSLFRACDNRGEAVNYIWIWLGADDTISPEVQEKLAQEIASDGKARVGDYTLEIRQFVNVKR